MPRYARREEEGSIRADESFLGEAAEERGEVSVAGNAG